MPIAEFVHVVETQKNARQALGDLWKAAVKKNWVVLGDHDFAGIVGDPSVEIKSIGLCQAELARLFIQAEPRTALCMPCNVVIHSQNGVTKLMAMKPAIMLPALFEATLQTLKPEAERVEQELIEILEAARI
jgi:uncharacterized protein (DUF302 family)